MDPQWRLTNNPEIKLFEVIKDYIMGLILCCKQRQSASYRIDKFIREISDYIDRIYTDGSNLWMTIETRDKPYFLVPTTIIEGNQNVNAIILQAEVKEYVSCGDR